MSSISKLKLNNQTYTIKDTVSGYLKEADLGTAAFADKAVVAIGAQGEDVTALPDVEKVKAFVSNKVSGAMHFKGVVTGETLPPTTNYEAGDVIIWKNKEYVCYEDGNTKAWEQLGDDVTLYATQTALAEAKGTGWVSTSTIQSNKDAIGVLQTSDLGQNTELLDHENRIDTLEGKPAMNITSGDINNWNSKQNNISDLADIRSGASKGATAVQPDDLATVATTGKASDLSTDANHLLVTQAEKDDWNSATVGYIRSVDTEFNVDTNGKLGFNAGYNALTDGQSTKLAGIFDNATKVEVDNEASGKIKINNVEKDICLPNTVQDANYHHIDVTNSSVSDGTNTFNKYVHPTQSGQVGGFAKIQTDVMGHITGGEPVTGDDIAGLLYFKSAYNAETNKIATESDIAGIAGGMHFRGVYESLEQIKQRITDPHNGDIAIAGANEYVYAFDEDTQTGSWHRFGDETAWDEKGAAQQAYNNAISTMQQAVAGMAANVTATSGYALTGITEANGIISKASEKKIPSDNAELTNGADYKTGAEVTTAINNAIFGLIDTVYQGV